MKTTLCTRVGIEVPIIQAPMAVAVGPALASAIKLPLAESQRRRLKDVLEYQKDRQTFLR